MNTLPMHLTATIRREGALFVAWTPELDVASQGASQEEALANLREAVELLLEDGDVDVPEGHPVITTFEVRDDKAAGAVGS